MTKDKIISKARWYHVLPATMAFAIMLFSYFYMSKYLDSWIIRIICVIIQMLVLTAYFLFSKKTIREWSNGRFFVGTILPLSLIPTAILLIDRIDIKTEVGLKGVLIDKKRETTGRGGAKLNLLRVRIEDNSVYYNSVLVTFYNQCNIGDSIKLDFQKGALGLRRVTEYYK